MVLKCFFFFFNYFSTGKFDKRDFEMPIIPQTLKINNMRTASAKFINLHNIRKLIEYSLKKICVKATLTLIVSKIFMYKGSWVLWLAQLGTGSERVNCLQRYTGLQEMKVIMKNIFTSKVKSDQIILLLKGILQPNMEQKVLQL